jgi:hypothetical protein
MGALSARRIANVELLVPIGRNIGGGSISTGCGNFRAYFGCGGQDLQLLQIGGWRLGHSLGPAAGAHQVPILQPNKPRTQLVGRTQFQQSDKFKRRQCLMLGK